MRRPSPLPPPPGTPSRGPEPRRGDEDAPPPSGLGRAPATFDAETAELVPLPLPDRSATEPEVASDAAETGLRDVWRASRARRRALRAEVRRFTVRQRRRRRVWIGVGIAFVVMVLGTVGAAYSPLFAVERVEVVGAAQVDAAAVADALSGQVGTPLALVDGSAVKAALVQFPLVESYTLEARPPHDLIVRIVERTPVGVVQTPAGYTLVDAAGVVLSTTPDAPAGQPVLDVSGGTDSEPFRAAGRVVRALPDGIRSQVTAVSASTTDDVTLTLGATGTRVAWGSADRSAEKARVLDLLMQKSPPDQTREYDVTSPEAGVVR